MTGRLIDVVRDSDRRMVMPLMGFRGCQLTGTTIRQNTFNWRTQYQTIQSLADRFQPHGMFFFMDLSVEASALGLPVRFPLDESPSVEQCPVKSESDLERFADIDIPADGRILAYLETMKTMSSQLAMLSGAYVIGPLTLAGLLMGASDAAMATIDQPNLLHATLELCSESFSRYARALETAGADMVCILEPTASVLSPRHFDQFSDRYPQSIISELTTMSILHICGQISRMLDGMVSTGAQGLRLGHMVDMPETAERIPSDMVLIGNLDPVRVFQQMGPKDVYSETRWLLESMAPHVNFILSTGCDLPQDTPHENIAAMVAASR